MGFSHAIARGVLLVLVAFSVASVAASPRLERPAGRSLKAATDYLFNFYSDHFPTQNIMVCDDCSGYMLNAQENGYTYDGFQVWVGGTGTITNNGAGGYDNWQFRACPGSPGGSYTRSGDQGKTVTFPECECLPNISGNVC